MPSRAELPTWHWLLWRARLGFSSPQGPGAAQRGACLWLNQQTCGVVLWGRELLSPLTPFPRTADLAASCFPWCWLGGAWQNPVQLACQVPRVARGTHTCPVLAEGKPSPAFSPPRERKVGFVLQNSSSSCQVLAAPSASRSSSASL